MSERNLQIVQEAYAAFGRRDIGGVLASLSDDIVWESMTGAGPHVPHAGRRTGKRAVSEFFETLLTTLDYQRFEVREFIAQGDRVVVLGSYAATPRSTGNYVEADWVMVFRLRDGLVTDFREFTDTAGVSAAYEPRANAAGR